MENDKEKRLLKIWEKNGRKRGYLSEHAVEIALGMEVKRYKTGNVKHSVIDGYEISHTQCNKIFAKYDNQYYDFVAKEWSFPIKTEYDERIDNFFKENGEIC